MGGAKQGWGSRLESASVGGLPVTALEWLATSHLLPCFQEVEAVERIEEAGMRSTFAWARQELKVRWDGLPRTACFQPAANRAATSHRRVPPCSSIPL